MNHAWRLTFIMMAIGAETAFSQAAGPAGDQVIATASFVYLSDESTQGGDALPGGATTYALLSAQYNKASYFSGLGLIYQMNSVGENQSDNAVGLKIELYYPAWPFYFEYVPYSVASQTFTNRSIVTREGTMTLMGFGMRSMLLPWLFFDGSFKIRTTTYTKEDGASMSKSIIRTEKLPYLGLGFTVGI